MTVKRSLRTLLNGQTTAQPIVHYEKVPPAHIVQGVRRLNARQVQVQRYLRLILALTLGVLLLIGQVPQLIYGFYHVMPSIHQVVLTPEVVTLLDGLTVPSDHSLWFGLLFILRLIAIIWFTRFIIHMFKAIHWLRKRLQRLIVALMIFVAMWQVSGTELEHYQQRVQQHDKIAQLLQRSETSNQTELQRVMQRAQVDELQQDYVMAQAYLLQHQAQLAAPFVSRLITAEQQPQRFAQYHFDSGALLAMQQALYGKAMTTQARAMVPLAEQAQFISHMMQYALSVIAGLGLILALILWRVKISLGQRIHRIKSIYDQDWRAGI